LLAPIIQANRGGFEKYPHLGSCDQLQYCASSKCKGMSVIVIKYILKNKIIKSKTTVTGKQNKLYFENENNIH
jgi:hypothetical protein